MFLVMVSSVFLRCEARHIAAIFNDNIKWSWNARQLPEQEKPGTYIGWENMDRAIDWYRRLPNQWVPTPSLTPLRCVFTCVYINMWVLLAISLVEGQGWFMIITIHNPFLHRAYPSFKCRLPSTYDAEAIPQ